jgi:ribosomal protein L34E
MTENEITYCDHCNAPFECKPNDIKKCHCSTVFLSKQTEALIQKNYNGCLCIKCLTELNVSHL